MTEQAMNDRKERPDAESGSTCHFDLFDKNGRLLAILSETFSFNLEFHSFRMSGNRLFFVDPRVEMCVYEYKIIDPD